MFQETSMSRKFYDEAIVNFNYLILMQQIQENLKND